MSRQIILITLLSLLIVGFEVQAKALSNAERALSEANQAHDCTSILSRVERLECYDRIFIGKPLTPVTNDKLVHSASWYRAVESENRREEGQLTGWVKSQVTDSAGNEALWFSVAAGKQIGEQQSKAILLASCIKDISRLELVLPQPINDTRALISLGAGAIPWTFDEQGLVLRSGRGLSAIEIMRPLAYKKTLTLRANIAELDGLTFNTPNAQQSFAQLKELCGW